MSIRLTPLNIVSSLLLLAAVYPLISGSSYAGLSIYWLLALVAVCFVADIVLRSLLKDIRRIWKAEALFLIFVFLLIAIIRTL